MKKVATQNWLKVLLVALSVSISIPALANYRAAQAAYVRKDYVTAASAFFNTYGYPRGPGEKQKSEWGLAQSLHRLGFYYSASKYYSIVVRRGPKRKNPFFRQAMSELGKIDTTLSLGQSHIVQLFKAKIDPASVPGVARGFYFYYLGVEQFAKRKFEKAAGFLRRVPSGSPYYIKAVFHLGVISNLRGSHSKAITYFQRARSLAPRTEAGKWIREQAIMNIARVHYETKRYRQAIQFYGLVPRGSYDVWLQAHFEASWTFFMMQKHNQTLGTIHTIHSPFFTNRFFPESYILQAITFLRLCRFKQVKASMSRFKGRYQGAFSELRKLLNRYEGNPKGFFGLVYNFSNGSSNRYTKLNAIFDALTRTDYFKEAESTLRFSDQELGRLSRYGGKWANSGLLDELKSFLRSKKSIAVKDAGRRLYDEAAGYYSYLFELSNQTKLINTEMVLGRVDRFRAKLNVGTADKKANFIGGLSELKVGQDLEYWPFEGEYWEDELGGYVYNLESLCGRGKKKGGKKKK